MTTVRCWKVWVTVAAGLLVASCAELSQVVETAGIRKPTVVLDELEVTSLGFEAIGLSLSLAVDNPNPVPVKLSGFDYAVFVEDHQLTAGEQRQGVEIAARGKSSVEVPVQFRFGDLYQMVKGLVDASTFDYRVDVAALVDVPVLGNFSVPAETSGTLPIPRIPGIAVAGIRIANLGLTGADLVVGLDVTNPNAFGLDITGLAYRLEVGGTSWLESALARTVNLTEGGSSRVEVPLRLNLLQIGSLTSRALAEGTPLEYRLHGDVEFDTSLPLLQGVSLPFDSHGTAPALR